MRHLQQYRKFEIQDAQGSIGKIGDKTKGEMAKDKSQVQQGWVTRDNSLYKKYVFDNFDIAIEFINEVAEVCNQMNHHPKWTNIYKTVECWLRTHDAESITEKDIQLAQAMDQIASRYI
jgi:4a-hydroxytetrahydrobiopterin dehydratase